MIPASRRRVGPIYRSPTGSRRCDRRATARRHRSVAPRLVYDGVRRAEVQEESKPDSVRGGHLSRPCGRSPQATAPYPGLGEQRHRPCFGLQRGGLPLFTPARRAGLGLCGSNCRLPDPGLRRAPCSVLSGLSSTARLGRSGRPSSCSHKIIPGRHGPSQGGWRPEGAQAAVWRGPAERRLPGKA